MSDELKIMDADDGVSGFLGEVYITYLDTNQRYCFARLKQVEAKVKYNNKAMSILGKVLKAHKQGSGEGTGTGTLYYCDSMQRKKMESYKDTGKLFRFDMDITNDDKGSNMGAQTTTVKQCLLDEQVIAKIDVDAEALEEDISFTFDDYSVDKTFERRK